MKCACDFLADFPVLKYDEQVTKARQILRDDIFRELYIHDGKRKLLGYIDITDVLRVTATKSNVTIEGYIRDITPVSPDTPVREVLIAIRKNNTNSVPVVDDQKIILGGVFLNEVFPFLITQHKLQGKVADCMSDDVTSCAADDTLQRVHTLIIDSGFTAFPVIKKKKLVGMISETGLLGALLADPAAAHRRRDRPRRRSAGPRSTRLWHPRGTDAAAGQAAPAEA